MFFELTDFLRDNIRFSMEDQTVCRVVDAQSGELVEFDDSMNVDDSRFYALPSWNSDDGYDLLESFTGKLYSPLARTELRRVLSGGRGVFRKFKDVIKTYPEVERQWHFFKDARMNVRIDDWYNNLRESWGLEKIESSVCDAKDETDELIQDDFEFCEYNPACDADCTTLEIESMAVEFADEFDGEQASAFLEAFKRQSDYVSFEKKRGILCRSHSGDFSGCILYSFCPLNAKSTVLMTDFFVPQNYRGLGIGKELLSRCIALLKNCGIQRFLLLNSIFPKFLEPLLVRFGFEKVGSGFVLNLLGVN